MGELLSPFYLKEDAILATEENMNNITEAGIYTLGQPNLQSLDLVRAVERTGISILEIQIVKDI